MSSKSSFTIETEISPINFDYLLKFIEENYLRKRNIFKEIVFLEDERGKALSFKVMVEGLPWSIDASIVAGNPILVEMYLSGPVPEEFISRIKEDLFIGVQVFEDRIRQATLYFTWVEGKTIVPEKVFSKKNNLIIKVFSESMLFFFLIFIFVSIFLFIIFGPYTPIFLVMIQFIILLFSGKIVSSIGDWEITKDNPYVHILQYQLTPEEFERIKVNPRILNEIKNEVYNLTLAKGKKVECETAKDVFSRYGLKCVPESVSVKILNLYDLVEYACKKFNLSIPKIIVSNITIPNAAASGISSKYGVMLITTGLLVQLNEEEILTVVGHELSHIKGKDTVAFFTLASAEYVLRVYVLWPLVMILGFIYLLFAFSMVYFIAKFFESKADLESAIKLGKPKVLAEALRKIGFRRLVLERDTSFRIRAWLGFDPHPPIYFRIKRLEELENPEDIKHPLLKSIKDNVSAFISLFK
ncbi:MAG: M56 family metallopeptidase [Nitrososphaeria archaeon]